MRKIRRWGVWLLLIIPLALNAQQRAEKFIECTLAGTLARRGCDVSTTASGG